MLSFLLIEIVTVDLQPCFLTVRFLEDFGIELNVGTGYF
jgi:hypothetical protein